jgi:N-hydroxyarylamine O-acetyltransferase
MFSSDRYLQRIGMSTEPTTPPSLELLAALQLAHLIRVPFENLDVFHRRGVRTDTDWSYPKIVEQGRGGWCFELNGCFGELLRALGFTVDYISCQVWDHPGGWGPPLDHLGLLVHLDDRRWFVDVGFGDNCLAPLPVNDGEYPAVPRLARIEVDDDGFLLTELMPDEGWLPQLKGSFRPRQLAEFTPRSEYLKTTPDLNWSQRPFATRALDADGSRVTLRRDLLRVRTGSGPCDETPVAESQWSDLLAEHFALSDSLNR